jgi:hypothetical protein
MMQCEEGKAALNAFNEQMFYECDSENKGSLSEQDLWTFFEK